MVRPPPGRIIFCDQHDLSIGCISQRNSARNRRDVLMERAAESIRRSWSHQRSRTARRKHQRCRRVCRRAEPFCPKRNDFAANRKVVDFEQSALIDGKEFPLEGSDGRRGLSRNDQLSGPWRPSGEMEDRGNEADEYGYDSHSPADEEPFLPDLPACLHARRLSENNLAMFHRRAGPTIRRGKLTPLLLQEPAQIRRIRPFVRSLETKSYNSRILAAVTTLGISTPQLCEGRNHALRRLRTYSTRL